MKRRKFFKSLLGAFAAVALDLGFVQEDMRLIKLWQEFTEWLIAAHTGRIRVSLENYTITPV